MVELIRRHQVVAFFLLTFVISWGLWVPLASLVFRGGKWLLTSFLMLTAFGPALAGIAVSTIVDSRFSQDGRGHFRIAFVIAWVEAAIVFFFYKRLIEQVGSIHSLVAMSVVIAMVPALVISSAYSRISGIRSYLASLRKPPGGIGWYFIAISLLPFLQLMGIAITLVFGKEIFWQSNHTGGRLELAGMVIFVFLYQFFYANCLGEEIGWRGFALLKLQARYSPLFSSLIIVFFWVPWHFPLWQAEGKAIFTPGFLLHTYMLHLAYTVIFAWLYNHSNRSIIVAGLAHASANVGWHFLPKTAAFGALVVGITILIIAVDRMWRRLPADITNKDLGQLSK